MAKLGFISLFLCFLVLLDSSLAFQFQWQQQPQRGRRQPQFNECQLDRLEALEPHSRMQAEAGTIEAWNPRDDPLQCAGVSFVRYTIETLGLLLPSYTNSPQLLYIEEGRGMFGVVFPGCAETFEEEHPSRSRREEPGQTRVGRDRHQKIRHFREGDVIALPAGVAHWVYNYGDSRLVAVSLYDKRNHQNQLDQSGRKFFLAGNPVLPRQQEEGTREQPGQEGNNVFSGFDTRFLANLLNLDEETVRKIQGHDDRRKNIVRVKGGGLDVVAPPRAREEREREEQRERDREGQEWGRGRMEDSNGLEETICSARLRENIGDSARADVFNPEAGRISTVNSFNLPILNWLELSAERGVLYRNAISIPHWNTNAHSLVYVTRGRARVQVVDHNGNSVFRDELRRGQLLFIPQNFAVGAEAGEEGFEYISFKTNDNAMVSTLAGRTSVLAGFPEDVVANIFQVPREQARQIKFNPRETRLIASTSRSRGY